jgi:hypothetical protein
MKWYSNFYNNFNKNSTTDGKNEKNPFRALSRPKTNKTFFYKSVFKNNVLDDMSISNKKHYFTWNIFNESRNYKFKDLKSSNLQFLNTDKNLRNTVNIKSNIINKNFLNSTNISDVQGGNFKLNSNIFNNYLSSTVDWTSGNIIDKISKINLTSSTGHNPIYSNNPTWRHKGYDRVTNKSATETPDIFRGKEDVAPNNLFTPFWYSYYKNISLEHNYNLLQSNSKKLEKLYIPNILEYAEYYF